MEAFPNCRKVLQTSKSTKNKKKQKLYAIGSEDVPFPFSNQMQTAHVTDLVLNKRGKIASWHLNGNVSCSEILEACILYDF